MRRTQLRRNSLSNPRVGAFLAAHGRKRSDPRVVVRRVVSDILTQAGYRQPPVNLANIAQALGVTEIVEEEGLLSDAVLRSSQGTHAIHYSPRLSSGRRNFAILHELAHILFDRAVEEQKPFFSEGDIALLSETYSEEERLCEFAASEFLFPALDFEREPAICDASWPALLALSKRYGASLEATLIRCGRVGSCPFYVERWTELDSGNITRKLLAVPDWLRKVADTPKRDYEIAALAHLQQQGPAATAFKFWLGGTWRLFQATFHLRNFRQVRETLALVRDASGTVGLASEERNGPAPPPK